METGLDEYLYNWQVELWEDELKRRCKRGLERSLV